MSFMTSQVRTDAEMPTRAPDLVRWGPVIAGVVLGLAFFALVNTLWLALAATAGDGWISGNLQWFTGVTGAVAMLLAGLVAGVLAGVRGKLAGLANGITAWSVVFLLAFIAVLPGLLVLAPALAAGLQPGSTTVGGTLGAPGGGFNAASALWTGFWTLLAGLLLAGVGGVLGGRIRRPVKLPEVERRHEEAVESPEVERRDGPVNGPATNGTVTLVDAEDTGAHRGQRQP